VKRHPKLTTVAVLTATLLFAGACDDDSPSTDTNPDTNPDGGTQVDGVDETVLPATTDPDQTPPPNDQAGGGQETNVEQTDTGATTAP
jgi:hypothetical protein